MFDRLKELREYEGLTQLEIAKILHVKRSTYAGWECGKDIIPLRKLNDLANFYHVTLDYLIGKEANIKIINTNHTISTEHVAKCLKQFRIDNHLSQTELAKAIKTSQSNIHKYETGKSLITTTYALEFAKHYHYSLDKLVNRK